jgi:hypothetical protein
MSLLVLGDFFEKPAENLSSLKLHYFIETLPLIAPYSVPSLLEIVVLTMHEKLKT